MPLVVPTPLPSRTRYLFIDGGSLISRIEAIAHKYFNGEEFVIDFARIAGDYTKVFYYDAIPVKNKGENEGDYHKRIASKTAFLDAAAATDRVHIYEGDARKRKGRGLEQKKVDVKIAVDMLTHTFRRNMQEAVLFTGDNDFKPLIDALVYEGMFVYLWYPPGATSQELINAADARRPLTLGETYNVLTDESRKRFRVPKPANCDPSISPGQELRFWRVDGVRHALNQDGKDYVVTKDVDHLNRLHVRHSSLELLRDYCLDTLGFEIPDS